MILTTTQQIEGHTIREYKAPIEREKSDARINSSEREEARPKVKGVVTGETIIGANFVKDFFAGIRDIVGIDIDYETIGETRSALPLA